MTKSIVSFNRKKSNWLAIFSDRFTSIYSYLSIC